MLVMGCLLLLTVTMGEVSSNITSKVVFRLIPLCSSIVLLLVSMTNLGII